MEPNLSIRPLGPEITAVTNYFGLKLTEKVFKYHVKVDPEPPEFKIKFINTLLRQKEVREKLDVIFKVRIFQNFSLYSPTYLEDGNDLIIDTASEEKPVKIIIMYSGLLEMGNRETENFLGRFFKMIQNKTGMQSIGRKYFDPNREKNFDSRGFKVWPGFSTSLNRFGQEFLVNIDLNFKVLRKETVYDIMQDLHNQGINNDEIRDKLISSTVITKYNNKMYRIFDIKFNMDPYYEFEMHKEKTKVTLLQYYAERYKVNIRDKRQPLILFKEKKRDGNEKELYLIPELCLVTGLSDQQRNDYNTMKELATITKPPAYTRVNEAQGLLNKFHSEPSSCKIIKDWNLSFEKNPYSVEGVKLDPGNYLMALDNGSKTRSTVKIEGCTDLERKIQQPMFSQPSLKKWAIFYPSREKEVVSVLMKFLVDARDTFHYPMEKPKEVEIRGDSWKDYEKELAIIDSSVDAAVFILAGGKKNGKYYLQTKANLFSKRPVPSQVVLSSTLKKDRNLRSICNNILMQICAKLGGSPWAIDKLPFTDEPTMIIGMDVSNNLVGKKPSLLCLCSTVDMHFSKYWSVFKKQDAGQDISLILEPAMEGAIKAFEATNTIKPVNIIIFRDGVSDSMRKTVEDVEVNAIRRVFKALNMNPKLIFVCVNKRVNTKFFVGDNLRKGDLSNPRAGSVFSKKITTEKDFYLVSHEPKQGAASPSHYYVLINDFDGFAPEDEGKLNQQERKVNLEVMQKIQMLSYKLCYMYYNSVGSIKIPAPIQYAHRLNELIGDKLARENVVPHPHLAAIKSLYFI